MTLSHLSIPLPISLSAIKMSLLSVPASLLSSLPSLAFWFFTFLVALSIVPRLFPKHGPLKFVCRSIIMYTLIFSFSFMGMVISFASYWTKWRYSVSTYVSRLLTGVAKYLVGVNVRVIKESESKAKGGKVEEEGEDVEWKEGMPAVYVVNHQSTMDVMVMGAMYPSNCVSLAKKSLKYVPLLGQYMTLIGTIFVDRSNPQKAISTLQQASETLKSKNLSVLVFPEGTRARLNETTMLEFKKGAFHIAVGGELPIVPVVISRYGDLYDSKQKKFEGGEVVIKVLQPVSTKGLATTDIPSLIERTRNKMIDALQEISAPSESPKKKDN